MSTRWVINGVHLTRDLGGIRVVFLECDREPPLIVQKSRLHLCLDRTAIVVPRHASWLIIRPVAFPAPCIYPQGLWPLAR